MAEICCGVVSESEGGSCESGSRAARRPRMELRRVRVDPSVKRRRLELCSPRDCDNAPDNCGVDRDGAAQLSLSSENGRQLPPIVLTSIQIPIQVPLPPALAGGSSSSCKDFFPKFGFASVCGRRRDMEDAVASHPSFCRRKQDAAAVASLHYFGVYDGHGCSHVNYPSISLKKKKKKHNLILTFT